MPRLSSCAKSQDPPQPRLRRWRQLRRFRSALATASQCGRPGWGSALRLALATRRRFARALCFDLTAWCLRGRARDHQGQAVVRAVERSASLRSEPQPTLPRRHCDELREDTVVFKGALASTGHRGRVDARGHRIGEAPGLTRTSNRSAGVPSREGRSRAPSARSWVCDAKRRAIVRHDKERWRAGRSFASSPVARLDAGRGHRRGLDGPSMPKLHSNMAMSFFNTPRCWRGRVGRGLDRREPGRSGWKPPVRQPRPLNAANLASARR